VSRHHNPLIPKPIIAAVNGLAHGDGSEIAEALCPRSVTHSGYSCIVFATTSSAASISSNKHFRWITTRYDAEQNISQGALQRMP